MEDFFCRPGKMENRIMEQQIAMFADLTSTTLFRVQPDQRDFGSIIEVIDHNRRG